MPVGAAKRSPLSVAPLPLGDERDREVMGIADSPLGAPDEAALAELEMADVVEQADGSAIIQPQAKKKSDYVHHQNLAELLDSSQLGIISQDLREKIKRDKEARAKRDEQYAEGIKRTGLGNEAPGGAQFTGASKAVHPMLAEASVDFESSAIKELFPAEGPARPKIVGPPDQKKLELAERQQRCFNWMLTQWVPEYINELERVLTQTPLGGSQYMKFWYAPNLARWTCEAVYIDDVYVPFSCNDFWQASRITHVQRLTESQVEDRIESGMYRDVGPMGSPSIIEETKAEKATDKIEGKARIEPNIDGERPVFETNTTYRLPEEAGDEGKRMPYLISIDDSSGEVMSIYRNWDEQDRHKRRLHWLVDWNFVPWRGAYAIGLPHLIGGLSAAATGALRALLDSAHVNNIPGGLILKGWGISGQTTQPQATQYSQVQGSNLTTDDIRKIAMPFPVNPPSDALFKLLGWLGDQAKGVVTTSEEKIADASNTMPVGTALALIESGAKVYRAIHKRLHRSQERAFDIIARIVAAIPDFEQIQIEELGEVLASPNDFKRSLAVQPASDPEVFSEGQRMARAQILESQSGKFPQLYNMYAVQKRILQTARIPDIDEVLPPPTKPMPLNAAAENAAAASGKPLIAFPEQAHLAHIMTHLLFLSDGLMGPKGVSGPGIIINIAEHLKQHVTLQYAVLVRMVASESIGQPIDKFMTDSDQDPRLSMRVDQAVAAASPIAMKILHQQLAPIEATLLQLFTAAQQAKSSSTVPNPDAVAAATLVDEQARKSAESAARLSLDKQEHSDTVAIEQKKLSEKVALDGRKQALAEREQMADEHFKQQEIDAQTRTDQLMLEEVRNPGNQVPGV